MRRNGERRRMTGSRRVLIQDRKWPENSKIKCIEKQIKLTGLLVSDFVHARAIIYFISFALTDTKN